MAHAPTYSTAFSEAIQATIQTKLLTNLRATLVWANPEFGQQGEFDAGTDSITFIAVPDLSLSVSGRTLTEGATPDARAMTISTVSFSTQAYGGLVLVTDIAKRKSPIDIVNAATERLHREANEVIDRVTRDVIAAGGTWITAGTGASAATTRAGIDTTNDLVTILSLRKLKATMYKNKVPLPADRYYRLYVSPEVALAIQNDTTTGNNWTELHKYIDNSELIQGEVGRIAGFRIIEVVNAPTFASVATVHASIAVGGIQPFGTGDLQTLTTPHTPPGGQGDELHQKEFMGWKVNFGVGVLSNSYYYRMESAVAATL